MTKRGIISAYVIVLKSFDCELEHTPAEWQNFIKRFCKNFFLAPTTSGFPEVPGGEQISFYLEELMERTDFLESPASTVFHGAKKTGLIQHSMLTARNCLKLAYYLLPEEELLDPVQYFLAGFFHDFCKVDSYTTDYRNVKDEDGNWVKKPYYKVSPDFNPMGHGVDSIWRLLKSPIATFIDDKVYEAIRWHMGTWEVSQSDDHAWHTAERVNKLVMILEFADRQAANWQGV